MLWNMYFFEVKKSLLSYLEWIISLLMYQYTMVATWNWTTTAKLDDGRLDLSETPCFWRELFAAVNSLRLRKQTNKVDMMKKCCFFLYEAIQVSSTNIFTVIFITVQITNVFKRLGSFFSLRACNSCSSLFMVVFTCQSLQKPTLNRHFCRDWENFLRLNPLLILLNTFLFHSRVFIRLNPFLNRASVVAEVMHLSM